MIPADAAVSALPPGSQPGTARLGGLLLRALPAAPPADLAAQLARLVAADRTALHEIARRGENGRPGY